MTNDDIMTVKVFADYLNIAEKTAYRFAPECKASRFIGYGMRAEA